MHVVIEVNPETFSDLMKRSTLFIGYKKCLIDELFDVVRCFKCSAFGHIAINCKSKVNRCSLCAENQRLSKTDN